MTCSLGLGFVVRRLRERGYAIKIWYYDLIKEYTISIVILNYGTWSA